MTKNIFSDVLTVSIILFLPLIMLIGFLVLTPLNFISRSIYFWKHGKELPLWALHGDP